MHARSNDRRPVAPSGVATLASRLLVAALYALGVVFPLGLIMTPASASAQTSVVDVCTGVALPRSVVTDIVAPVIIGVATPIENTVNGLLSILAPRLNVGATAPAGERGARRRHHAAVAGRERQCRQSGEHLREPG